MAEQPPGQPGTTSVPDAAEALPSGLTIGGYQIDGIAGRGGMGVVYRATQQFPRRTVALKVIRSEYAQDVEFRSRFQREADLAATIEHPNVIPIFAAGDSDGLLYLAMRYVEGIDLRAWLIQNGPMPAERAGRIIVQVAEALDEAHSKGLVHRDVKPGNILLTERGGRDHVYLTDFGLTKRAASSAGLTKSGSWVGTVDYSAPEQIRGEHVDARSDVYSLGCVLFELLSGQVPFDRDSDVSKMFAHVNDPPPRLAAFSPALGRFDEVIQRALSKDSNQRFESAGDLGRAASAAAEARPIELSERSVAVGQAAPVADPDATRIDDAAYAPPGQPPGPGAPTAPAAGVGPPAGAVGQPAGATIGAGAPTAPPGAGPGAPTAPPGGAAPPTAQPGAAGQPPGAPGAGTAAAPTRRRRWIPVAAVVALLVIGGAVAAVLLSGGTSDEQLVMQAVDGYYLTSGSNSCNYLSPANLQNNFGGLSGCRKQLAAAPASTLGGTQMVQVNGTVATDQGFTWNGHPLKVMLVKQNGKWLLDTIDDKDIDAIQATATGWAQAAGSSVCNFDSPKFIQSTYNGSLAQCRSANANAAAASINGNQNVNYTSDTTATDAITLSDGTKYQLTLGKQPDGKWLVDDVKKQ